jgi:putative ABC transport system permease protein
MEILKRIFWPFIQLVYQSIFLALGQIWANRTRSILTTLGIIIGIAAVTSVVAALNGLKANVLAQFEAFGARNIYVWPERPRTGRFRNAGWEQIRIKSEQLDHLLERCPSVENMARVSDGGSRPVNFGGTIAQEVHVWGVEPAYHKVDNRSVTMGRQISELDNAESMQVCLIDARLRDELKLERDCIGQSIYLMNERLLVVGLIEPKPENNSGLAGGSQYRYEIYIPLSVHLKMQETPFVYAMATAKADADTQDAVAEIKFFMRGARRLKPGEPDNFQAQTVESYLNSINQTGTGIMLVTGCIASISLLVGGVGIMNIMLVSVSERTREIGLRKAVGAKKFALLTQFLVEAIVLCLIGGLLGVALGYGITALITKINPMMSRSQIPAWATTLSVVFSASVGLFFGLFPAVKAAQLDPIEALRHE